MNIGIRITQNIEELGLEIADLLFFNAETNMFDFKKNVQHTSKNFYYKANEAISLGEEYINALIDAGIATPFVYDMDSDI